MKRSKELYGVLGPIKHQARMALMPILSGGLGILLKMISHKDDLMEQLHILL
jgi:hypothetical protein